MKNLIVLFLIGFVLFSCVSGSISNEPSIDGVVENFAYGLENKDIDTLMNAYWPEAVFTFIPPEGEKMILTGSDAIKDAQKGNMESPAEVVVRLDTAKSEKYGMNVTYTIFVESDDLVLTNILEFEKRNNEWRIIKQVVKF